MFFTVQKHGYPSWFFSAGTVLLTIVIASTGLMAPGAESLLATSLSMCSFYLARYYWGPAPQTIEDEETPEHTDPVKSFCAHRTHDFAVQTADTEFAVKLLQAEQWEELATALSELSGVERQGFYANFDYGKLVPAGGQSSKFMADSNTSEIDSNDPAQPPSSAGNCLIKFTNSQPHSADAHVLYGHYQLCEAKRLGLRPGAITNAGSASALAIAFRHFRLALRLEPDNPEALCGLILAKGFTGLSDEHIEQSLQRLLAVDELHFHGLVAAACFLVHSTTGANRFVSVVERAVGSSNVTAAFARIVAHVECMTADDKARPSLDSRTIADLHAQLRIYQSEASKLGLWQQGICNNIAAFAFEKIGDTRERAVYLEKADGLRSPYPWARTARPSSVNDDSVTIRHSSTSA